MGGPGLDFETWVFREDQLLRRNPGLKIETWATHSIFNRLLERPVSPTPLRTSAQQASQAARSCNPKQPGANEITQSEHGKHAYPNQLRAVKRQHTLDSVGGC